MTSPLATGCLVVVIGIASTQTAVSRGAGPGAKKQLVAHRGASAYAPEHTLDSYRLAIERLRETSGRDIDPRRTVAIEDSKWGLESAQGTGLRLVGVTNSYPANELTGAELVVDSLTALTLPALDRLCAM